MGVSAQVLVLGDVASDIFLFPGPWKAVDINVKHHPLVILANGHESCVCVKYVLRYVHTEPLSVLCIRT